MTTPTPTTPPPPPTGADRASRDQLNAQMADTALAFRGYNITNLGRTADLLEDPRYSDILSSELRSASAVAAELLGRPMDLLELVRKRVEPTLEQYADSVALIMAIEGAHLRILEEVHGIQWRRAKRMLGYSLGEVSALVAGGVLEFREALRAPLLLADDCAALAADVQLGVLFSRGQPVPTELVQRWCLEINQTGEGVIGVSALLSPNSLLLMGQRRTISRLRKRLPEAPHRLYLRGNDNRWPPLHTPIVWSQNIPCRAGSLMHTIAGGFRPPQPPIISLVTGAVSYNAVNIRETLRHWTDHPQRLWDAVYQTLACGVKRVIHVGPEPNIIPATFRRLSDNVIAQTKGNLGMRTLAQLVQRPWLQSLLPERTALLRAPQVRQMIVEDWLLE